MKLPLLKISINNPKYVNVNRLYSFDWATYYILTGGRGIGKTTNIVGKCIDQWDKTGKEFVYMRRYNSETGKAMTLLSPIVNNATAIPVSKGLIEYRINNKRVGYAIVLAYQQDYKSGIDFSNVNTLVFDEAIMKPKGVKRYLTNEVQDYFLEIVSTIFRNREGYKVFLLGNNSDLYNPYNAYFKIPIFSDTYKDKKRQLYCEYLKNNPVLEEEQKNTPLAKLTEGTTYFDYNFNNKLLVHKEAQLGAKLPNAELITRFVWNDFTLNIYKNSWDKLFVEFRDKKIKDSISFTFKDGNIVNYPAIKLYKSSQLKHFIDACYYNGNVWFDTIQSSTLLDEIQATLK